jgi:hypothetical protein
MHVELYLVTDYSKTMTLKDLMEGTQLTLLVEFKHDSRFPCQWNFKLVGK